MAKSVIIIGGGVAGLSAAARLARAPAVNVTVLEAAPTVGGRCKSAVLPHAGLVELGATWFHGTVGNPAFEFAVAQGVCDEHAGTRCASDAGSDGAEAEAADAATRSKFRMEFVRPGQLEPLRGGELDAALLAMAEYAEAVEAAHGADGGTIGAALRAHFDRAAAAAAEAGGGEASAAERRAFVEAWATRERLQRAYDGFSSSDASGVAFAAEYEDLPGPNIPAPGGFGALAERLARTLPPGTVRCGAVVRRIDWSDGEGDGGGDDGGDGGDGVVVSVARAEGGVEERLRADAVICTVSLGVLKADGAALFTPPLPAEKQAAVASMHIGLCDKLFVEWPPAPATEAPAAGAPAAEAPAAATAPAAEAPAAAAGRRRVVDGATSQPCSANMVLGMTADDEARSLARGSSANAANACNFPPGALPGERASMTAHCLLWPTDEALWTSAAAPRGSWPRGAVHPVAGAVPDHVADMLPGCDPVYDEGALGGGGAGDGGGGALPAWLRGLHSWRLGPGPEWCSPARDAAVDRARERCAVLWVTGAAALAAEAAGAERLAADVRALLRAFPALPLPEGASADEPGIRVHASRWALDERFRGSYSYYGLDTDAGAVDALAAPLLSPRRRRRPLVCFAGEATHRTYMGTVHGAWLSGEREADRLLSSWGLLAASA